MPHLDDHTSDAAARTVLYAQDAALSAGLAAGAAAEVLGAAAVTVGSAVGEAMRSGAEHLPSQEALGAAVAGFGAAARDALRSGADHLPTPEVLEGVLENAVERGTEAWDALLGRRRRRWPWALGSAAAGAAAAVAVTLLIQRLSTRDAPGAQEPDQVRAVVDPGPAAAVPPGGVVDEDGEAIQPR